MSTTFYCVMRAPSEKMKYGGMDHMVAGGIYLNLEHAKLRAEKEQMMFHVVWIEEYDSRSGIIDVMTQENLVRSIYL